MIDSNRINDFPSPPVHGSELLAPITSWEQMHREAMDVGVEFEHFWFDSVQEHVAYFFRWLGQPRATVLVIWQDDRVTHVECRKMGDIAMTESELTPVNAELSRIFMNTSFTQGDRSRDH